LRLLGSKKDKKMYSTKNNVNENILPKDLSYITVGDPYTANKEMPKGSRHKGVQFKTNPSKNTCNGNWYFGKMEYKPVGPIQDQTNYRKTAPLDKRKLGFGTKNAPRRDEFASTVITEQYREGLRAEARMEKKKLEMSGEDTSVLVEAGAEAVNPRKPVKHLYDIGRKQVTAFDQRRLHDRHFDTMKSQNRHLGNAVTSSSAIGDGVETALEATGEHRRVRMTKTFFDRSHLSC